MSLDRHIQLCNPCHNQDINIPITLESFLWTLKCAPPAPPPPGNH